MPTRSSTKRKREDDVADASNASAQTTSSIDDTNKMREKLGLKPLGKPAGGTEEDKIAAEKARRQAELAAEKEAQQQALEQQLEKARHSRMLTGKVVAGKGLGDMDDGDDSALAFVKRQKKAAARKKKEKELAEKRAKELDEQEKQAAQLAYTNRDLSGLQVGHGADAFESGETRILTLADRSILDDKGGDLNDEDDMLIDIHIAERERKQELDEKRKQKPKYDVYAAADGTNTSLLSQYDEEKKGDILTLDASGSVDMVRKAKAEKVALQLDAKRNGKVLYDLAQLSKPTLASDTMTESELMKTTFKKPKRKRKKKSSKSTAALLAELAPTDGDSADHGSRSTRAAADDEDHDAAAKAIVRGRAHASSYQRALHRAQQETRKKMVLEEGEAPVDGAGMQEDGAAVTSKLKSEPDVRVKREPVPDDDDDEPEEEDDDADDAHYAAMIAARRKAAARVRKTDVASSVIARRERAAQQAPKDGVVFSATTEFISTLNAVTSDMKERAAEALVKKEEEAEAEANADKATTTTTHVVGGADGGDDMQTDDDNKHDTTNTNKELFNDEPVVATGMAAALAHARARGMLTQDDEMLVGRRTDKKIRWEDLNAEADQELTQAEKDKQRRRHGRDRMLESETRNYNVNLQYKDDDGNVLTPKEAFRYLSYKFHGIEPSANKKEKYERRKQEDMKARQIAEGADSRAAKLEQVRQQKKSAGVVLPQF